IGGAGAFASLSSQGLYGVGGLVMLFWMGKWRRQTYHKLAVILLLMSIVILVLVFSSLTVGVDDNRNWIRLGCFSFHTAEWANLAFCVWAAYALKEKLKTKAFGKDLLVPVVFRFGTVIVLLVMSGKDLGTVLIILMIIATILYLGGMRTSYLLITAVVGLIGVILATMQSDTRMMRIDAWLGNCSHPADS